jgi:hypothetical protein
MRNTILWFISLFLVLPSVSYSALSQEDITIHPRIGEWRITSEQAEPSVRIDGSPWCPVRFKQERSTEMFDRTLYSVALIKSDDAGRTSLAMSDSDPFFGDQLLELLRSFECGDRGRDYTSFLLVLFSSKLCPP